MNIAIFASGEGSNAAVIMKTFGSFIKKETASLAVVISNNEKAGVLNIAADHNIPCEIVLLKNKTDAQQTEAYFKLLEKYKIEFIVLAGYLKKLPKEITNAYFKKIINIHPALLPAYGGAGMYGKFVHKAVISAGETQSGITVHYVDEVYDHGQIIFQVKCAVEKNDTAEDLAQKILGLEHKFYTEILAKTILSQIPVK